MLGACGSHMNLYVPALSVIWNVFVPTSATSVLTSTPSPVRWKLCASDLSSTVSVYAPAGTLVLSIEMVKPGPTVALSAPPPLAAGAAALDELDDFELLPQPATTSAAAAIAASMVIRCMNVPPGRPVRARLPSAVPPATTARPAGRFTTDRRPLR